MRTHLHEVTEDFAQALRAMHAGKQVVLTERGAPMALIEPLRPASREEERAIVEMIDSGMLQPMRRKGSIREWKWKTARSKAA